MKIGDLEFFLAGVRLSGAGGSGQALLVRLTADSGLTGWGEAKVRWREAELGPRRDALLPALAGRSIFDVEELHTLDVLDSPQLRCAVEMACWDLMGRATGQPLCHLLGGAYRERIPLAVRLTGDDSGRITDPAQLGQLARETADQGLHCQIIGSAGQMQSDLEMVRAVRESVGERIDLRLDGAAAYDLETARELCAELDTAGLQFFIDPLRTAELYPVASLRRQTGLPLAVCRPIRSAADLLAMVRSGAAPQVILDLDRVGGILPARKCTAIAEAAGIHATLGGGPCLGIATAAMLHLAAATPALSGCNESAYHRIQDDVLAEPLEIIDGMIAVPQAPGLGVEVQG